MQKIPSTRNCYQRRTAKHTGRKSCLQSLEKLLWGTSYLVIDILKYVAAAILKSRNDTAVRSHAVSVLDELDSLAVQGTPYYPIALRTCYNFRLKQVFPSVSQQNRVLQLGKLARMTMTREAIRLGTKRQLSAEQRQERSAKGSSPWKGRRGSGTSA